MKIDAVIISGAGRGIGRAIALDLAKNGTFILCISKSKSCAETANEINNSGGKAEALELDIKDYEKTEKALSDWLNNKPYKNIGLVLAAGILGPKGPLTESSLKEWDDCHKVNVLGALAIIKSLLPRMLQNRFGRIVTFAGGGAAYPNPTFPAYSETKTAMVRITENINEDLKDKGDFSIVCLGPGAIETDMLKQVRDSGGIVKTTANISEPVSFVKSFLEAKTCGFSGSFVHVRNNWADFLNTDKKINDSFWKLRRVE